MAGQTVEIPLVGGQDTSAEPTIAVTPQLMLNCTYNKQGGVKKRAGCTKYASNAAPNSDTMLQLFRSKKDKASEFWSNSATPYDSKTLTLSQTRQGICAWGDNLVRTYNRIEDAWNVSDVAPTGYVSTLYGVADCQPAWTGGTVTDSTLNNARFTFKYIGSSDMAVHHGAPSGGKQNGRVCVVWTEVDGRADAAGQVVTVYASVFDATSKTWDVSKLVVTTVTQNRSIPIPESAVKVVEHGSDAFLILYRLGTATEALYGVLLSYGGSVAGKWALGSPVNYGDLVTGVVGSKIACFDAFTKELTSNQVSVNTAHVVTVSEGTTSSQYTSVLTSFNTLSAGPFAEGPIVGDLPYVTCYYTSNGNVWVCRNQTFGGGEAWFGTDALAARTYFSPFAGSVSLPPISRDYDLGLMVPGSPEYDVVGFDGVTTIRQVSGVFVGAGRYWNGGVAGGASWVTQPPSGIQLAFLSKPVRFSLATSFVVTSSSTESNSLTLYGAWVGDKSYGALTVGARGDTSLMWGPFETRAVDNYYGTQKFVWLRRPGGSMTAIGLSVRTIALSSLGGLGEIPIYAQMCWTPTLSDTPNCGLPKAKVREHLGEIFSLVNTTSIDGVATSVSLCVFSTSQSGGVFNSVPVNGTVYTAGGCVRGFDGERTYEVGLQPPRFVGDATVAGVGALTDGVYTFAAVQVWSDANGNKQTSAPTFSTAVDTAGESKTLTATVVGQVGASDAHSESSPVSIDLYVTEANGSVFYKFASIQVDNYNAAGNFVSTVTLGVNPDPAAAQLYTVSGELDNVPPPGCRHLTLHQGRLVLCGTPTDEVWYSKEVLPGEIPAFNEGLVISPFEGGRVLGGASLDDYLVLFKEGGVYGIRGTFPDDTGNGGNLSPPFSIQKGLRLQDSASIITTALGVFFNTDRGIWILTRQGSVEPVGLPIRERLGTATINAAVYNDSTALVMFFCSSGDVFAFDTVYKTWSTFVYKDSTSTTLTFEAACIGADGKLYATDAAKRWLWDLSSSSELDDGVFVPMKFKTGYVKSGAALAWQRVKRVGFRGRKVTDANVTLKACFDYDEDTTESRTFVSDAMGAGSTGRECQMVPAIQKCSSFSVEYTDAAPTGSGHSTGNGTGFVLQSMTLEIVPKAERRHLAPGKVK